jgi:hypothetical protein
MHFHYVAFSSFILLILFGSMIGTYLTIVFYKKESSLHYPNKANLKPGFAML